MRIRTVWNWRLKLYPFIVIPWIIVAAQSAAGGEGKPANSSRKGIVAGLGDSEPVRERPSSASAAPIQGFHQGRAITCFTHPKITHCFELKQPNTIMDR